MSNPYAKALGAHDPVAVMATTPERLTELLAAFTAEQIEAAPTPGKWSVREVMCHLADCEMGFGWRLRITDDADHPTLQPFDQDRWARAYARYTFEEARAAFLAMRGWNLAWVRGLSEADKVRPAMHPERGEMTLWTIVETIAGHDRHHLTALEQQAATLRG